MSATRPADRFAKRRTEQVLFLTVWVAFAFFHQGGGRNQNVCFAMARAMVEEGRFAIDSYLFYSGTEVTDSGRRLTRTPLVDGKFTFRGQSFYAAWIDDSGETASASGDSDEATRVYLSRMAASPYVSYADGRFYPNKAPGVSFLAAPAYFVLYHVERLFGADPDNWWVLTLNAWLTSALSVGLVSAFGCLLLFRVVLMLWGVRIVTAVLTAFTYAFGTMFFPYATMLYEHNVVAVGLLASFYLVLLAREQPAGGKRRAALIFGGLAAGYAAVASHAAVFAVLFLAGYVLLHQSRRDTWQWFGVGLLGSFLLLSVYYQVCFGTPFTTHFHFQNPLRESGPAFLTMLEWPRLDRLAALLFSPFRGLFFSSPVLLMGVAGLVWMWRTRARRLEALLFSAVLGVFLLLNASFTGWHGGWGVAPRYLGPAVPFLVLPVALGFQRYFRTTALLAAISMAGMGLVTAVDPQAPVGLASIAAFPGRAHWLRSPLTEYEIPLFFIGGATPILNAQFVELIGQGERDLATQDLSPEELEAERTALRERLERSLRSGRSPFVLAQWAGPVSVNPIGVYESWFGRAFRTGSSELRWNSFNAGEFFFPGSRWSLSLLLALCLPLGIGTVVMARDRDQSAISI